MALATYGDLKQSIADWLVRDDLVNFIPDLVRLGEIKIDSSWLEVRENELETTGNLTESDEKLALPADFRHIRTYTLQSGGLVFSPQQTSVNELLNRIQSTLTGQPQMVAVFGTDLLHRPTPDSDYAYTLKYVPKLDLTAGADAGTNAVLTKYPDLYLFSALAEAQAFIHNDERIPLWNQKFEACLTRALGREDRERFRGFPIYPRAR